MKVNIIDNFFEEQLFLNIQNHVTTKLFYTPRYFEDKTEKNEKNYYGSRFILSEDPELLKTFITQAEKKFKIKIKKLHPDKTKEEKDEEMIEIIKAYRILSDKERKEKYDKHLGANQTS